MGYAGDFFLDIQRGDISQEEALFALRGNVLFSKDSGTIESHPQSYVVCQNGKVAGVYGALPAAGMPVYDCGDALIVPGLVDLHLHAPQYEYRGLGMNLELLEWLNTRTFPTEAKYGDLAYAKKAYRLFTDGLVDGATTRACIFATMHLPATMVLMEQLEQSGLITLVGKVSMDRNSTPSLQEASAETSLAETRRWLQQSGQLRRTRPILTPRFVPSCSDEVLQGLGMLRAEYGLPVQSHLAENLAEVEWVAQLCPDAASYADAYARHGLLDGGHTVMAHCVHCTDEEIQTMAQKGVFMAHCPNSNANLSSGIAPVRTFLRAGVPVGLGTDVAGGFTDSIFRAMSDAVQHSKLRWRLVDDGLPALTLAEAFYLGTKGGGAFFGKVGSFEKGYEFDALVIDDSRLASPAPLTPVERLERVVYLSQQDDIRQKYVAGRRVK